MAESFFCFLEVPTGCASSWHKTLLIVKVVPFTLVLMIFTSQHQFCNLDRRYYSAILQCVRYIVSTDFLRLERPHVERDVRFGLKMSKGI